MREVVFYVGVYYSKVLGNIVDVLKVEGKLISEIGVVLGVRIWF